jgi:hypothetical protein
MLTESSLAFVDIDYTPLTTSYDQNHLLGTLGASLSIFVVV